MCVSRARELHACARTSCACCSGGEGSAIVSPSNRPPASTSCDVLAFEAMAQQRWLEGVLTKLHITPHLLHPPPRGPPPRWLHS